MPSTTTTLTTLTTTTKTTTGTKMAKSTAAVSLKTAPSSSYKNTIATLRSLYPRAARAFLQRNVALTHSLLSSAFSNLEPPPSSPPPPSFSPPAPSPGAAPAPVPDPLHSYRRKWDLLRITFETTLCTSVPPHTERLPDALHALLVLSPPSLLATMHTRSLRLFTPVACGKPSSEFLPSQILVALVLASIKMECAQVGREMIEDWLSRRTPLYYPPQDADDAETKDATQGYEKVLEMYCLHVLPRLEDWDYAREFLRYESELSDDTKAYLVQSLQILHAQHLENLEVARERERQSLLPPSPSASSSRTATPRPPPSLDKRAPSPSPSSASTSSNSTHTVVPYNTRQHSVPSSLTSLTPTVRPKSPAAQRPNMPSSSSASAAHRSSNNSRPNGSFPSPPSAAQMFPIASSIPPPSLFVLLKTSILPYLTAPNVTFFVLMFLVPFVSFLFRLRRRRLWRLATNGGSTGVSAAAKTARGPSSAGNGARRRLTAGWWTEIRRAVTDTVKMASSGIV